MFRPWRREQRPAELGTGKQIGSQIQNARGFVPPPPVPLTVNSSAFFLPLRPLLGLLSFSPGTSFPTCGPRLLTGPRLPPRLYACPFLRTLDPFTLKCPQERLLEVFTVTYT